MMKKLLNVLLVILMCVSLFVCSNNSRKDGNINLGEDKTSKYI